LGAKISFGKETPTAGVFVAMSRATLEHHQLSLQATTKPVGDVIVFSKTRHLKMFLSVASMQKSSSLQCLKQ